MPLIAQICMVVVTIAVVAMAGVTIRLTLHTKSLIENANRSLADLPALIEEARKASARADDLMAAFTRVTRIAESAASRVEGIAMRSSSLADALLNEVEPPLSRAAGLLRGIRAGASHLIQRWQSRAGGYTKEPKGVEHVGEQRWLDDGGSASGSRGRGRAGADLRAKGR